MHPTVARHHRHWSNKPAILATLTLTRMDHGQPGRRVRPRGEACDRPDCQNLRMRFQGMCASKAILERERDALETRNRILARTE